MVIPEKMIDLAMRSIIDYYDKSPSGHYIDKQYLIKKKICGPEEIDPLIKYLCSKELIDYGPSFPGGWDCIQLKNRHYFEDKRDRRKLEKKETRRFWIEIVKDVVIFILGLVAEGRFGIVQSIIDSLFSQGK